MIGMKMVAVIGAGDDKFTAETRKKARALIEEILAPNDAVLVSGRSPVGGIDVFAEEVQDRLHPNQKRIFAPKVEQWDPPGRYGYKARNLDIARESDIVHVIIVKDYPPLYTGMRFDRCYHCLRMGRDVGHCKSGACWTGEQALKLGKEVVWHVIE